MTLEEKQSFLGNTMPAIPRLGITAYNVWGEPSENFTGYIARAQLFDKALMHEEVVRLMNDTRPKK